MSTWLLSTMWIGKQLCDLLVGTRKIDGIIGLSERADTAGIAGYEFLGDYCRERRIPFVAINDYDLQDDEDRDRLLKLDIDTLIVYGWQRLIPLWFTDHCKLVIGCHGSAYGITRGRGNSPLTWALLMGKREFEVSIFRIDFGMDSGEIIGSKRFPLMPYLDVARAYELMTVKVASLINVADFTKSIPQYDEPRYLPQRIPEDGAIDWMRSWQIVDFVRAQTAPYPCAYTTLKGEKIKILQAALHHQAKSYGQIGEIMIAGERTAFVRSVGYDIGIQTAANYNLTKSDVFDSVDFKEQMRRIVIRHYQNWPSHILNEEVDALAQ